MSSQRLIACQEGDKLKMDISHMKKLLIATALLSVSAGSMAATGDDVAAPSSVDLTLNAPVSQPTCSLVLKSGGNGEFAEGATLNVSGTKVANTAKVTASYHADSIYKDATKLMVGGEVAANDMDVNLGDFTVSINDANAKDTTAKITVEAKCESL